MVPGLILLLSLLLGIVEVNAAPFDKGNRQEEMVTRCIIEVLSNALAKPNAPPIDPECKEILKKSNRHNQDEEEDDLKQYEIRTKKEPGALDNHQHDSKEEEKKSPDLPKEEYEEKRHHAAIESREENEEGKENEKFDEKEEGPGHSKERTFVEGEDDDNDEERGDHKDHYKQEDSKKLDKYHGDSEESAHDILDKRAHHTPKHADDFPGEDNEDDAKELEEIIKRHPLSKSWKEQPLQLEKFHSIHSSKMPEENDEWEEEKEKRNYKPNHEDLRQRLYGYEEKRNHHEPPRNDLTDEKTSFSRGQKSHFGDNSLENHFINNNFDKRFHYDKEISEEEREKKHHHQDSEEETEHHDSSEESNEKELTGHRFEDKRQHEERKRWPSQQNSRLNYEESNEDSEESEERIDKRHEQEKENFYRKLRHHLQESDEEGPFRQEKKQDEKRYYIGEEMVDGIKRYYPKLPQEKDLRQHEEYKNNHRYREGSEESNLPDNEMYKHKYAEEKKSSNKHGLSNDPLRWQSRYFENADNGEEERKRSLQVKNVFPDYGDYDLWGKRQFLEDMNHYGENRNPTKTHKLEEKREYDRMDELAQLLNYKKKSVEFPDFYDSEELKKRHYDERGRYRERPLTEEEEKELENLAIMDLELQKIAEKLSNNRQG